MIYVLHGNTVGKSVDWTELYEFSLTVKKICYTRNICSVKTEILIFKSYLNKPKH